MSFTFSNQTVLAFDFGQARIGVAVGSFPLCLAHPLTTITARDNERRFAEISKLIDEWQAEILVVGLPTHADGTAHEMTALARKFAQRLHGRFRRTIFLIDERFSSLHAESLLKEAQVFGKKQKRVLDQVAAQAILSDFFSETAHAEQIQSS